MEVLLLLFVLSASTWGLPTRNSANLCLPASCLIEKNCRCSSESSPFHEDGPAPQLIAITVSESIVTTLYDNYLVPLLFDRVNPDGNPIGATFYVNHEYTDYELVQNLWLRGFEIGSHSITKNSSQEYWRNATLKDLVEEFEGQRQIISKFAKIPIEDIKGARTPQLQLEGDISIEAYRQSGITYDNSWPTVSTKRLFPYTLDYKSSQQCTVTMKCPEESHPGFWVAPITNIKGAEGIECNSLATCLVEGTPEEIAAWLLDEVLKVRNKNRAPLIIRLDSYCFQFNPNNFEALNLFFDQIVAYQDVFLVSVGEILDWVKNPVAAKDFKTATYDRDASCNSVNCRLFNSQGQERYMKSCVQPCPKEYPWKGNPTGDAA